MRARTAAALMVLVLAVVALAGSASSSPADRKKKRKPIKGSFTVQALPFPRVEGSPPGHQKGSCRYGVYVTDPGVTFKPRSKGVLTARMDGFAGDWDLYLLDATNQVIVGATQNQVTEGAPAEETLIVGLERRVEVRLVACNWSGGPQADVAYELVFK
ncbi:MAG: hypothetical protein ABR575_04095 [Actinomycetota bacterium]